MMNGKLENTEHGYYYVVKIADNGIDLYDAPVHVTDWMIDHARYLAFKVENFAKIKGMDWKTAMKELDWTTLPNAWKKWLQDLTHDFAVGDVSAKICEDKELFNFVVENCMPAAKKVMFGEFNLTQFQEEVFRIIVRIISTGIHWSTGVARDAIYNVCSTVYNGRDYEREYGNGGEV